MSSSREPDFHPAFVEIVRAALAPCKAWMTTCGGWTYGEQNLSVRINPSKRLPAKRQALQDVISARLAELCSKQGFEVTIRTECAGFCNYLVTRRVTEGATS